MSTASTTRRADGARPDDAALTRPRRPAPLHRGEARTGWLLTLPTTVIVISVIVVPILWNLVLALRDVSFLDIARHGIFSGSFSLEAIGRTLTSSGFWRSVGTTVIYSVLSTFGSIAVGLIAALALRAPFRGRGAVRALMLLPYVAPVVAVAFVWQVMLNPQYGIVNHYLQALPGMGQGIDLLGQRPWALLTVIAFEIWRYFPFALLFLSARLVALPADVEEAALMDGVTPSQNFRHVVLPQIMGTIALLSVLRLIMTFNKFDDVYLLTGGAAGTEVAAVRVYDQLMGSFDIPGAAATALVLALIMVVFLLGYGALQRRAER